MKYKGVKIKLENGYYNTVGLTGFIQRELKINKNQRTDEEYLKLVCYLIDYVALDGVVIKPNETIAFHSWILQFVDFNSHFYEIWEAHQFGDEYRPGVEYAIEVVAEQEKQCALYGATPLFPLFSQNIVISKGVYEGLPVEGVRYPDPNHMCGWWLITDQYDQDIKSLMNVHFFHVAFKRPDILKYLALPFGYRFISAVKGAEIWYDEKVLE